MGLISWTVLITGVFVLGMAWGVFVLGPVVCATGG